MASPLSKRRLIRSLLKASFFFVSLCLIFYLLDYAHTNNIFDFSFADKYLKNQGLSGLLFFWVFAASFSAVGTPRQILAGIAGYSFGFGWGLVLATISLASGAAITFFYARFIARDKLRKKLGKRALKFESMLLQKPFFMTILVRFLPLGNNTLTNIMAGISAIDPRPFFCGTLIGYLPQNMIFALMGGGIALGAEEMLVFSALLFIISGGMAIWLYSQIRSESGEDFFRDNDSKEIND